ncbi:MAG: glycoside hydrolase family 16 protein [Bacteroidaceae bacterium]|nr:glycoside hydrolase family 16 protein [Bacteroidaceae bacterium]
MIKSKFLLVVLMALTSSLAWAEDYPISFKKTQAYTHASRRLNSVMLTNADGTKQTLQLPTPQTVYSLIEDKAFSATAGETLTAQFGYSGTWMNGFVYIDFGQDGNFEATLNADGTMPEGSDAVAFSYAEPTLDSGVGYNSLGNRVNDADVLNPPSFKLPETLANGFYRMRFKVDWASIDPAGRPEDGNGILKNGGAICDVALNVHAATGKLSTQATNGSITLADGQALPETIAFGTPLNLKIQPAKGYALDVVRIKHGHNLAGEATLHGVKQHDVIEIPAYLMQGDVLTIPAEYIDGDVEITTVFTPAQYDTAEGLYAIGFDKDATLASDYEATLSLRIAPKVRAMKVAGTQAYVDLTGEHQSFYAPEKFVLNITDNRDDLHYYLYIDLNNDGKFTPMLTEEGKLAVSSELVAFTHYNGKNSLGETVEQLVKKLPEFSISPLLPEGVYRMRLKADVNNISPSGSQQMIDHGGVIVDYLLNITRTPKPLKLLTTNGNIYARGNTAHPNEITPIAAELYMALAPAAPGFEAQEVVVRHGHNLSGAQYVNGNIQWFERTLTPKKNVATLSSNLVNGAIEVTANFEPTAGCEWELVFNDEFNAENYSQPVNDKWMRCQRYGATWNRWLSDSKEVVYLQDGDLVTRAIPNPDTSTDNVPMITGGIKSNNRFGFTYGIVEGRILSNPWIGNFPAFWMMPEDQSAGWPDCGEIDIWETIDEQQRSWHTVHSNWTYDLGKTGNPQSSFNVAVDLSRYHTYRLEWTPTTLVWFVDGKEVGRYTKSSSESDLAQGQWPFDKHFHLILNQSVGNGAWAANADVKHTYETRFDWVRVYQKKGMLNTAGTVGIHSVEATPDVAITPETGGIVTTATQPTTISIFTLTGCKIAQAKVSHTHKFALQRGIYIVNGQKVVVP